MRELSKKEAEEQARTYAREMVEFLNASNSESRKSNGGPRTEPVKLENHFAFLYMRHLREHFIVLP
jgi:hypothetical protein